MLKQLRNILEFTKDLATDMQVRRKFFATVSEERYNERMEVCSTCKLRKDNTCDKCGCTLSIKARFEVAHCPEDKWKTM